MIAGYFNPNLTPVGVFRFWASPLSRTKNLKANLKIRFHTGKIKILSTWSRFSLWQSWLKNPSNFGPKIDPDEKVLRRGRVFHTFTFTLSHFHTFTLSHFHTFTLSHFHTFTLKKGVFLRRGRVLNKTNSIQSGGRRQGGRSARDENAKHKNTKIQFRAEAGGKEEGVRTTGRRKLPSLPSSSRSKESSLPSNKCPVKHISYTLTDQWDWG